jgi:hypothetical protein
MASVDDAPEPLRALARKIPPDTREHLGRTELRFRVEAAAALFNEAALADEREAKRLRGDGDRYLSAVSFKAYMVTASALADGMSAARLDKNDRAVRALGDRLEDFSKRNPQPILERAANGEDVSAAIAELMQEQQGAVKRRWFRRKAKNAN